MQVGYNEMDYFTAKFIINLFKLYCPTWQYGIEKYSQKIHVFSRSFKQDDSALNNDYEWYMVVQMPKCFKASFQVVLSKKNDKKLHPRDIIFQLICPIVNLEFFWDIGLLNVWKVEAIFRYHYVERYLEYIEPLVFECLNGG